MEDLPLCLLNHGYIGACRVPHFCHICSVKHQLRKVREHSHNSCSKFPKDIYAEFSNLVSLGP